MALHGRATRELFVPSEQFTIESERFQHPISVPPATLDFNVTVMSQLFSQSVKLGVIPITDRSATIFAFDHLQQFLVGELVFGYAIIPTPFAHDCFVGDVSVVDHKVFGSHDKTNMVGPEGLEPPTKRL